MSLNHSTQNQARRSFEVSQLAVAPIDKFNYKFNPPDIKEFGFLSLTPAHGIRGPKIEKGEDNAEHVVMQDQLDNENNIVYVNDETGARIPAQVPVMELKTQLYIHLRQFRFPEISGSSVVLADDMIQEDEDRNSERIRQVINQLRPGTEIAFHSVFHQGRNKPFALAWTLVSLIEEKKTELASRPQYRVSAIIDKTEMRPDNQTKSWKRVVVDSMIVDVYSGGKLEDMKYEMNRVACSQSGNVNVRFMFEKYENFQWSECDNPFVPATPAVETKKVPVKKPATKKPATKKPAKKSPVKKDKATTEEVKS